MPGRHAQETRAFAAAGSAAVFAAVLGLGPLPAALASPPRPDLVIDRVWAEPANPACGEPVTFFAQVSNRGSATASAGWFRDVRCLFLVDGAAREPATFDDLAPGESRIVSVQEPAPGVGSHMLWAHVNDDGAVAESSTSNNVRSAPFTVPGCRPPNDDLADLATLDGLSATATLTNTLATMEAGEPRHAGRPSSHSVWWKWTAPAAGIVRIDTAGSDFDTLLAIYRCPFWLFLSFGDPSFQDPVAADDDSGPGTTSAISFNAAAGQTYAIAAAGYGTASGRVHLNLSLTVNQPPIVRLLEPEDGGECFEGSTIRLSAEATDSDGAVRSVRFDVDGQPVAEAGSPVFAATWTPGTPGGYRLSALATDDRGATANSLTNRIVVLPALTVRIDGQVCAANHWTALGQARVELLSVSNLPIYYSLDGSAPNQPYTSAFRLREPQSLLRASTDLPDGSTRDIGPIEIVVEPGFNLLATTAGGGTIAIGPHPSPFRRDEVVSLRAVPAAGWRFRQWQGDLTGTSEETAFAMSSNRWVQAVFETEVRWTVEGQGTVYASAWPSQAGPRYAFGTTLKLTGAPRPGWYLRNWTVPSGNPLVVNVTNAGTAITGMFRANNLTGQYTVTVIEQGPGRVAQVPSGKSTYQQGSILSLTAQPDPGGLFDGWSVLQNSDWLPANKDAVTNLVVAADIVLKAVFRDDPGYAQPVFIVRCERPDVDEGPTNVVVTIQKNNSVAASVNYLTEDGSARGGGPGTGDYQTVLGNVSLPAGESSTNILLAIYDDSEFEGLESFTFRLVNPLAGAALGARSSVVINIWDNEENALGSNRDLRFPQEIDFTLLGTLAIAVQPTNLPARWRLQGEFVWRDPALALPNLEPGDHCVEFLPLPGYAQPPPRWVTVAAHQTSRVDAVYLDAALLGAQLGSGTLVLAFTPADMPDLAQASWRLEGYGTDGLGRWRSSRETIDQLPPGPYLVSFRLPEVAVGWEAPSPVNIQIFDGATNRVLARFDRTPVPGETYPVPVLTSELNSPPYCFTGQIRTSHGQGSGVVVREGVVLTAAHVLFDPTTLTYATDVRWFPRRCEGRYEPAPRIPRGGYVLSSYAELRRAEATNEFLSLPSMDQDVAVLYFALGPGTPGTGLGPAQGGYLVTAGANRWLTQGGRQQLVGYNARATTFRPAGRLFATLPVGLGFVPLTNLVYASADFVGFPGQSGGSVYAETDLGWFPAAVYLGREPLAPLAYVRALDESVARLIVFARDSVYQATGHDDSGIDPVNPRGGNALGSPGYLQVALKPAGLQQARWRLVPEPDWHLGNEIVPANAGEPVIAFADVPGYITPPQRKVYVYESRTSVYEVAYQPREIQLRARMLAGRGLLEIRAETDVGNTAYLLWTSSLAPPVRWLPVLSPATNGLPPNSFNIPFLPDAPARFFRASSEPPR